ncbi:hypothetical protein [Vibrio tasmaniensis]|uniref:hypothetical protein n=1 Tax=Vibrio tasmaniensis TaxID=212663 RepID=UPI00107F1AB8|nr:hypothetical protein [Vibrio tasmaniensis]
MGTIRGAFLDSSVKKIAKDFIEMESNGVVVDVNTTLVNLNEKHKLVAPDEISDLQNDVNLHIHLEKNKSLKSMSALGYGKYVGSQCVDKAKELMTPASTEEPAK